LITPFYNASAQEVRLSVRVMETSESLRRDAYLRELREQILTETSIEPERLHFTSLLVLYNNVLQSLYTSQIKTLGAVFLAIGVMFWVLFRSLSIALLALAPNILAAGLVLGLMGLAGIPLDIMTITIAAIVVGIGVDDCIHYLHRFRDEIALDGDYHAAMMRSHGSIGRAMYYTTLTVVVGFATLTLSNFTPLLYFGVLTVVAMIAAVAGALLLLPQLILIFRPFGRAQS
ncbi:MMPL family transporter, partial [Luminiphilus sp.]|nr:MMPL family transporter [Luminiphilus sp.]